jgi:hypothetical protein
MLGIRAEVPLGVPRNSCEQISKIDLRKVQVEVLWVETPRNVAAGYQRFADLVALIFQKTSNLHRRENISIALGR